MSVMFELQHGKAWYQYDDSVQQYLAKCAKDGVDTVELESDAAKMSVDLDAMTQKNESASRSARIRCVSMSGSECHSWSEKCGKSEKYLSMKYVQALEEATAKKRVRVSRSALVFDLKNMKVKEKGNTDDRDLKRIVCKGKPFDSKHKPVAGLKPAGNAQGAGKTAGAKKDVPSKNTAAVTKGDKRKKDVSNDAAGSAAGDADGGDVVMKSVVLKTRAPVDWGCPIAARCHVFCEGDDVWDCMLNQTNIQDNNNKFFLIQLLEEDKASLCYVWMRWGRVGFAGQSKLHPCAVNISLAKCIFSAKFQDKTKNIWHARADFTKVAGKYDLLKMDYAEDEPDAKKMRKETKEKKQIDPCSLDKKVQELIELMCNVKAMESAVMEMRFDIKKSPLGKLTEGQIRAGYEALKRIDELITNKKTGRELVQACSDFYTRVPHSFGMRIPPLIQTTADVRLKLDLLEALGDIQLALKLIGDEDADSCAHPADQQYRALDCRMEHLSKQDKQYKVVQQYLESTHGSTHTGYGLQLLDVFAVAKPSEGPRFVDRGNRLLLWHGSRLTNWAGILGAGLKIAPPEAPVTGYMFGKGIYFADMASKSANYCRASRAKNEGILLLSEVSLGNCNEKLHSDYRADLLPAGKHCTLGVGRLAPAAGTRVTLDDGVVVPVGPCVPTGHKGCVLEYNEYIVYDVAQVRMRYVLRVRFNFN